MLADPRSATLASNFGAQWLYLRDIDAKNPSPRVFPGFDLSLIPDFHRETELFLESVLREDHSVLDLLTANYTFLNERLAEHYGIPGVFGTDFRRVTYPDGSPRRGLLGHGSILTLTSYANRTSPVLRGKYVLANILGAPPPRRPRTYGPDHREQKFRQGPLDAEAMAQHRTNPAVRRLSRADGSDRFALDNFDAGRTIPHHQRVGRSDRLLRHVPGWRKFDGMDGLRKVLLSRPEEFVLTMSGQLLTYSLGGASSTTTRRFSGRLCATRATTISFLDIGDGHRQQHSRFRREGPWRRRRKVSGKIAELESLSTAIL